MSKIKQRVYIKDIPTIERALEVLESMNFSDNERDVYEARLKWLRYEEMAILTAEKRGIEKGKEIGIEIGEEIGAKIAFALIKGKTKDVIVKELNISIERVNRIIQKLGL